MAQLARLVGAVVLAFLPSAADKLKVGMSKGLAIAIFVAAGLLLLWFIYDAIQRRSRPVTEGGGDTYNITQHGDQSIGVNKGTVNFAPQPGVRGHQLKANEPAGDHFQTIFRIELEAPYAIERITVRARGHAIRDFNVRPPVVGAFVADNKEGFLQGAVTPQGVEWSWGGKLQKEYDVIVTTDQPDQIGVEVDLS